MINKKFCFGNCEYEVVRDYKEAFKENVVLEKITDYFEPFDYILGDYSYDVLRLKGFYDSTKEECRQMNDISSLDYYIENYCAYQCRYFLLKKIKSLKNS
ncbi:MAG: DUF1027 domain-containing protein [bacterium]|nr:DUF1027 domain-containing protein [bacterium]